MTIDAKAERVRRIAHMAHEAALDNIGIIAFVEWGNGPSIHRLFKADEAKVPWLIRAALLERLTMALMRLFDPPGSRRGQADPMTSGRDSLPVAFALLDDAEVRETATAPGGADKMATAIKLWERLTGDERIGRLRNIRDYMMAHTITAKWDFDRPIFSDPLSLAKDINPAVEALASGCGVATASLKDATEAWARLCTDYWVRLVQTPPVQDS